MTPDVPDSADGTLDRLTQVFRQVFLDESIQLDDTTSADDIEDWDSIAHVSLIFAVEAEFGITFETSDLEGLASVRDLRAAIARRAG